jgi:diguanylate cyclase (GGDEF)-like protein
MSDKDSRILATEVLRQFIINKELDELYVYALDGSTLAFYKRGPEPSTIKKNAFEEGKRGTYFSDIYMSKDNKDYLFTTSTPIRDYNNNIIGVLVAEVIANTLFEQIQDYSGLGSTGETLLGKRIGNEVLFLNPLRHDKNAALHRKVSINGDLARPVIEGSGGKFGSSISVDYRAKDVVAAWGYIPMVAWGIVAKIDADEALKPLQEARNSIAATALLLLLFGIGASFKMAIDIMRPVEVLEKSANLDTLTGLPNRKLLMELLKQTLSEAEIKKIKVVVMFIDLDGFKTVNDTFGHEIGDLLLQNVGLRLTNSVRQSDIVARIGGDEFVILFRGAQDENRIAKIASNIINIVGDVFNLKGNTAYIGASIGISIFPNDATEPNELIKQADNAMYEAKKAGKNDFRFAGDHKPDSLS